MVRLWTAALQAQAHKPATAGLAGRQAEACGGNDFRDRRDEAISPPMAEIDTRTGEVIGFTVEHGDTVRALVPVRRYATVQNWPGQAFRSQLLRHTAAPTGSPTAAERVR